MKSTDHGIEESKAVENMYHMRLMALLQELVRKRGPKGAARVLEIDPKTVAESVKTGQLSRRTRDSLERALQEGVGSAAAQQRERNEKLEGRVDALEKGHDELGKELRRRVAAVEGTVAAWGVTAPRGAGPVMPAPLPPRRVLAKRKPVRRTGTGNLRRSPRCAGSTPTLRRWSLPRTTRRYSAGLGP